MPISGVMERIESNLDLLAESEAKIARFILNHPESVLQLTVRDLAREAHSSQAAVIRLCRTLQINGYSQLKVLLTADLVRNERQPASEYVELNPATTFDMQLQSFAQATEKSIHHTLNHLSESDLATVSARLAQARRVFTFGVAASQLVAEDLAQKLTRLGYPVTHWVDVHLATMTAAILEPEDVAILISFSGATREVVEIAELIHQRGSLLVAVTQFRPKNPLAQLADVVFYVTAVEPTPRIGATTSVMASLLVGDALMLWLANREPSATLPYLKATQESITRHRV